MKSFNDYRSLFPIVEGYTYLNSAAIAPTSSRVAAAVEALLLEMKEKGISRYGSWMKAIERSRTLFSQLIAADPEEVTFVGNTSEGLSIVASGLDWKPGDRVLVPRPDFPANVYPWMNAERWGVQVDFFDRRGGRFDPADVEKALKPGTRLISVSSVDFATGFSCNLEALGEFCRRKGLLFCVDAIQSLGVLPMDVQKFGIHFLASGAHKWLIAAMGIGGLYISREVDHLIRPTRVGWASVENEEDFGTIHFDLKAGARRFETGTRNLMGIVALGAALELLLEVGVEEIGKRILGLNDRLVQGLVERGLEIVSPMGEGERSGILSFVPASNPDTTFRCLLERRVMVSHRGAAIRVSPHFFNDNSDIDALLVTLDSLATKP